MIQTRMYDSEMHMRSTVKHSHSATLTLLFTSYPRHNLIYSRDGAKWFRHIEKHMRVTVNHSHLATFTFIFTGYLRHNVIHSRDEAKWFRHMETSVRIVVNHLHSAIPTILSISHPRKNVIDSRDKAEWFRHAWIIQRHPFVLPWIICAQLHLQYFPQAIQGKVWTSLGLQWSCM